MDTVIEDREERCNYDEVLLFYDDRKSAQSAAVKEWNFGMKVVNHVFATYDCQEHFVDLLIDSRLSFSSSTSITECITK